MDWGRVMSHHMYTGISNCRRSCVCSEIKNGPVIRLQYRAATCEARFAGSTALCYSNYRILLHVLIQVASFATPIKMDHQSSRKDLHILVVSNPRTRFFAWFSIFIPRHPSVCLLPHQLHIYNEMKIMHWLLFFMSGTYSWQDVPRSSKRQVETASGLGTKGGHPGTTQTLILNCQR